MPSAWGDAMDGGRALAAAALVVAMVLSTPGIAEVQGIPEASRDRMEASRYPVVQPASASWWDAVDATLPRGLDRVEPPACREETCPLALQKVPVESHPDGVDVLPEAPVSPYPARDRDGDGTADLYLFAGGSFRPEDGEPITALSGADGSVQDRIHLDGDHFWPVYPYVAETDGRHVELFWVAEEPHEVAYGGGYNFTITLWSGRVVARQVGTGDILWEDPHEVHVNPNGSGWATGTWYSRFGDYVGSGVQGLQTSYNYSWPAKGYLFGDYDVTEESLVDATTRDVHWTVDGNLDVEAVLEGPDGARDLVVQEGGAAYGDPTPEDDAEIRRLDGADLSGIWNRTEAELGFEPRSGLVGTRAGAPLLLVTGPPSDGTAPGVGLTGDGTTVWSRDALPSAVHYGTLLGIHGTEDADLLGTVARGPDGCIDGQGWSSATPTVVSLADGRTVWSRTVNLTMERCDTRMSTDVGAGDFDDDGVSDIVLEVSDGFLFYIGASGPVRVHVVAGATGAPIHDVTFGGTAPEPSLPGMDQRSRRSIHPLHRTFRTTMEDRLPFLDVRIRRTEDLETHRMVLSVLDPAEGTWSNATIDHRTFNPTDEYGSTVYLGFPLNLFQSRTDKVVTWFLRADETCVPYSYCDDHSRHGVYVHDVSTGEEVWSRESSAPLDIQAWELLPG